MKHLFFRFKKAALVNVSRLVKLSFFFYCMLCTVAFGMQRRLHRSNRAPKSTRFTPKSRFVVSRQGELQILIQQIKQEFTIQSNIIRDSINDISRRVTKLMSCYENLHCLHTGANFYNQGISTAFKNFYYATRQFIRVPQRVMQQIYESEISLLATVKNNLQNIMDSYDHIRKEFKDLLTSNAATANCSQQKGHSFSLRFATLSNKKKKLTDNLQNLQETITRLKNSHPYRRLFTTSRLIYNTHMKYITPVYQWYLKSISPYIPHVEQS